MKYVPMKQQDVVNPLEKTIRNLNITWKNHPQRRRPLCLTQGVNCTWPLFKEVPRRMVCSALGRQNHVTVLNLAPHMWRKLKRRAGLMDLEEVMMVMGGHGFLPFLFHPY